MSAKLWQLICVVAGLVLVGAALLFIFTPTGSPTHQLEDLLKDPSVEAARSCVIVYAVRKDDRNGSTFVVDQVWKESSGSTITFSVGSQLPMDYQVRSQMPSGVVVFYRPNLQSPAASVFIYGDRVAGTDKSLDDFKRSCGF